VQTTAVFSFPDPVNETSARLVALGVVAMAVVFLATGNGWVLVPLTYGFAARVLTGPTLSPLGQLSTRLVTPWVERRFRIDSRRVPGAPKRFAQAIGLAFTTLASIAWIADVHVAGYVLIAFLLVAASLEAFLAICLGCIAYQAIWGCTDCGDIRERLAMASARARAEAPDQTRSYL
jgi:hypothetical protein